MDKMTQRLSFYAYYEGLCRVLRESDDIISYLPYLPSMPICQKGWDGCALLGQPSKRHPCRIFICFNYNGITMNQQCQLEARRALFICPAKSYFFVGLQIFHHVIFCIQEKNYPMQKMMGMVINDGTYQTCVPDIDYIASRQHKAACPPRF